MGGSPAHAAVPREGSASWFCCPLLTGARGPGARRFFCLPGVCQNGRSLRRTGWPWPVFPGSAIKWPVGRPDRRAPARHDGSRPEPWGGGLKGPACLCSSRPGRLGRARPFRGDPCGGPPGPSQPVVGGVTGTRCGAPGLPGPFSAPLGWLRPPGGRKKGACRPRKGALRASERQCGRVFGGFPPAPRPFEDFPSRGPVPCWVFPWAILPCFP